jgi:hypothetical protein
MGTMIFRLPKCYRSGTQVHICSGEPRRFLLATAREQNEDAKIFHSIAALATCRIMRQRGKPRGELMWLDIPRARSDPMPLLERFESVARIRGNQGFAVIGRVLLHGEIEHGAQESTSVI